MRLSRVAETLSSTRAARYSNPTLILRVCVVDPLALVKLIALMERTSGRPEVKIGVIDGPVLTRHPDLTGGRLREIPGTDGGGCTRADSMACLHGTFITGILAAKRSSPAPAICPDCTVLIRPIFAESTWGSEHMPSATPRELAAAMIECLDAGARVINLSLALEEPSTAEDEALQAAIAQAVRRGVIVVAAAGNQGTLGSSTITRHPWVIPVVACDFSRQTDTRVEPGQVNREPRPDGTWRGHHQPGPRWSAHARWDERGRAVRDWRDRAVVV